MWSTDLRDIYEADKQGLVERLMVRSSDSTVYRYTGSTAGDYRRVLGMQPGVHRVKLGTRYDVSPKPEYEWSARTAQNKRLHRYHADHSHTPKLIKVTYHYNSSRFSAKTTAMNEAGVHVALTEMQSRYVPMLFDVRMYRMNEDTCVLVMVMRFLVGISLHSLYEERKQETGRSYVLAHEKQQLHEALKDMWSVGCAHSDLHLNNIMLTRDGHLYVIDFSRSWLLGPGSYTQKITLAQQRKRIQAILGSSETGEVPMMSGSQEVYDVAGKYLHAYPNYFGLQDIRRRKTRGAVTPGARALIRRVGRLRQNISDSWEDGVKRPFVRRKIQDKRDAERRLNLLYGISPL